MLDVRDGGAVSSLPCRVPSRLNALVAAQVVLGEEISDELPYNDYYEVVTRTPNPHQQIPHELGRGSEPPPLPPPPPPPPCFEMSRVQYYGPDYRLHIQPSTMENLNVPENLEKIKAKVFEHLKQMQPVPNVQMHTAPVSAPDKDDDDDDDDPDRRVSRRAADSRTEHPAEFASGKAGE